MPKLPAELTDTIIDYLHQDKDVLASCALVCHEWLNSSRYHLFSVIVLDIDHRPSVVTDFILFLQSSFTLTALVRELIIGRERITRTFESYDVRAPLFLQLLDALIAVTTGIRRLKLHHVQLISMVSNQPGTNPIISLYHQSPVPPASQLQELYMTGVRWHVDFDTVGISNLLHLLPELHVFRMKSTVLQWKGDVHVKSSLLPPLDLPIQSIDLKSPYQPYAMLLSQVSDRSSLDRLTSLAVTSPFVSDLPTIGSVISKAGRNLLELRLHFGRMLPRTPGRDDLGFATIDSIWSVLNVKTCSSLRSFYISLALLAEFERLDPWTSRVLLLSMAVLASYLPTTIEDITMGIVYDGYADHRIDDLDVHWRLNDTGSDFDIFRTEVARLDSLRTFHLYLSDGQNEEDDSRHTAMLTAVRDLLQRKLSLSSGILR